MSEITKLRIKQALLEWRERIVNQLGLGPDHELHCARYSIILHDIFIDAIAENALYIRSVNDLRQIAYYWKWIDHYGADLFALIRDFIDRPKRCMEPENELEFYSETHNSKRMRTQV